MDLKKWAAEEENKLLLFGTGSGMKVATGQKIDLFVDLIPEFMSLKNTNYTIWFPPGRPENAEEYIECNLGTLLSSCLYDYIIVPINPRPSQAIFTYQYGLSESRGCRVSYNQFIDLIERGKLKPILIDNPIRYSAKFYEQIFEASKRQEGHLPPLTLSRNLEMFRILRFIALAKSMGVEPGEGWTSVVMEKHPELSVSQCQKEIQRLLGGADWKASSLPYSIEDRQRLFSVMGTDLYTLRILGFDGIAETSLRSLKMNPTLGAAALHSYTRYLADPITCGLLGFKNYSRGDVETMLFLGIIQKGLGYMWKDLLSSSPACSSIISPQTELNTVELCGDELTRFVDTHPEKELKNSMRNMNMRLGEMDFAGAIEHFRRFDQIVTESFNKEVRSFSNKARVAANLLRFGKRFLDTSARFAPILGSAMATTGNFNWLPAAFLGTLAAKWGEHRLNEIKPKDIVRWWTHIWPFSDPGLPFLLWHESQKQNR